MDSLFEPCFSAVVAENPVPRYRLWKNQTKGHEHEPTGGQWLARGDPRIGIGDQLVTNPSRRKRPTIIERREIWLVARIDEKRTEA